MKTVQNFSRYYSIYYEKRGDDIRLTRWFEAPLDLLFILSLRSRVFRIVDICENNP